MRFFISTILVAIFLLILSGCQFADPIEIDSKSQYAAEWKGILSTYESRNAKQKLISLAEKIGWDSKGDFEILGFECYQNKYWAPKKIVNQCSFSRKKFSIFFKIKVIYIITFDENSELIDVKVFHQGLF